MTRTATGEDIFLAALDKATPEDRAEFVEAACAGNPDLLRRVRDLLAAHDRSRGPLDAPPALGITVHHPSSDAPGTVVGPYKLLQKLGEGGMGTVFLAEQTHPVQRKVALKLIKTGMDSRAVLARFEAERQALALMDHPNIAKVLDAGATEGGLPYFVMELIKGVPITTFCDDHHLTCAERLGLLVQVCQAVQHAHQKGVIHRDIKPSNVMVCLYDGKPVPKVIDFGVAKATGQKLTDRTLFTEVGSVVGTLEYMSPEQAEINQLDVDTRSDIYSLGVLLYELLTGTTPLERKRVRASSFLEVLRLIREEEPPKPSTRLSTTEELPSIAANRGLEPRRLSGVVRGELDWIVMKALEKDRGRRYETANAFAADVQRHLADEPVQACPPSAGYRFRKFARRNRRALALVGTLGVLLVSAVIGLAVSNRLVEREKAETAAERDRTRAANDRLKDNLRLALQALDEVYFRLVVDRLTADPKRQKEDEILFKKALAFYEQFAEQNSDDPEVRREMSRAYSRAGNLHAALGNHAQAKQSHTRAVALAEQLIAEYPRDPEYRRHLASTLVEMGGDLAKAGDRPEADPYARRVLDLRKQLADEFDVIAYRQDLSIAHNAMGANLLGRHDPAAAARHFRESIDIRTRVIAEGLNTPSSRYRLAQAHLNLGGALSRLNDPDAALEQYRKALPIYAELVANADKYRDQLREERLDPSRCRRDLATTHRNIGRNLKATGDPTAEEPLAQNVAILTALVADVPHVPQYREELANAHLVLGDLLAAGGRTADAEGNCRKAKEHLTLLLADHKDVAGYSDSLVLCHVYLGNLRHQAGDQQGAAAHYRQVFDLIQGLVAQWPKEPVYLRYQAWHLVTCRNPEFRDLDQAVRIGKRLVTEFEPHGDSWTALGVAHYQAGDWKAALDALTEAARLKKGGDSLEWIFLAMTHWQLGHPEEARRYYDQAAPRLATQGSYGRFRTEAEKLMGIKGKKD